MRKEQIDLIVPFVEKLNNYKLPFDVLKQRFSEMILQNYECAVIVNDDRRILATGYNGFPRGIDDSEQRLNNKEEKYPRIIHAELNALMNALYNGVSVKGATLYVFGLPVCSDCTKSVIQAGIKRVVIPVMKDVPQKWSDSWNEMSEPMFKEAGVTVNYI
jgi:dCMP deaminase